jgi:hypothetical protein
VGEDVLPSFYPLALGGVGLDPCDGSEETFASASVSLDNDGDGLTDAADPDCAVNTPPVAADDGYTTDEDTPLNVAAPGVLGNDSDADGDPLTAAQVTGPTNGALQRRDGDHYGQRHQRPAGVRSQRSVHGL